MNKYLKIACFTILIIVCVFALIIKINKVYVQPNDYEIRVLANALGDIKISNKNDILRIQNLVIDNYKQGFVSDGKIIIENLNGRGFCYDRSLILQKLLIHNNISIRPVYLFYGGRTDSYLDIFLDSNLGSHSVFEFKLQNQYYVVRTNAKMKDFESIEDYLDRDNPSFIKGKTKYVRYLSNRNSRFITPSLIPDIYYFN